MSSASATASSILPSAPSRIDDRDYMLALFQRMIRLGVLFTLEFSDQPRRHTSTILQYQHEAQRLILDGIFPRQGMTDFTGQECLAEARFEGAKLVCPLRIEQQIMLQGMSCFAARLPPWVDYWQRRATHRVRTDALAVVAELYTQQGEAIKATLYDISPSGISLLMDDASPFLHTEIYRCTLYPRGEQVFHCEVAVCSRRSEPGQTGEILGTCFVNQDKREEHAIQRLVTELERQILRVRRQGPRPGMEPT